MKSYISICLPYCSGQMFQETGERVVLLRIDGFMYFRFSNAKECPTAGCKLVLIGSAASRILNHVSSNKSSVR